MELICRRGHPIIRNGAPAYDLFSKYPCFSSTDRAYWELYAPYFFTQHAIRLQNCITMDAILMRYRLLQKTDGYLISAPVPAEIKAEYDLVSLPLEDLSLAAFALYRKSSPKEALIREYIQYCMEFISSQPESTLTDGG